MTALTYIIGIATNMRRRARYASFVVAPDVFDRLLQEAPAWMADVDAGDPQTIVLQAPSGRVVVRIGADVCPGCVETWERQGVTTVPQSGE